MNVFDGDDLSDLFQPTTPTNPAAVAKRCRVHQWYERRFTTYVDGEETTDYFVVTCRRCGRERDEARAKRGKSSRRLGSDQERRAERVYGFEKVGERGTITDLQSPMFKVQQKATRAAAPVRWRAIFRELDAVNDGRSPLLLLSFVSQGKPTEDYFVVPGHVWRDLHGGKGDDQ